MRFFYLLPILMALCCTVHAQNLTVVTDRHHPVINLPADTRVIELDAAESLLNQSFADLPSDPAQAEKIARARLQSPDTDFQSVLRTALQGSVDAWSLGITKIPAVIVERYVVYGQRDVGKALLQIQAYREGEANHSGRAQP